MTELNQLLDKFKDDAETVGLLNAIKTNSATLATNLNDANAKLQDAITTRDKAKAENALVRKTLGLENITEEAIGAKLKTGDNNLDELKSRHLAEVQSLTEKLQGLQAQNAEMLTNFENEKNTLVLDNAASTLLAGINLKDNPHFIRTFKQAMLENVKVENGQPIPYHQHNGQLIPMTGANGAPITLKDKAALMLKDDAWKDFVIGDVKQGTGSAGQTAHVTKKPSEMSLKERYQQHAQKVS